MFSYQPPSLRTTFATGNAAGALQQTVASLGFQRVIVVAEHAEVHLARHLTAGLGGALAGIHPAQRHRSAADALASASEAATGLGADALVSVGSGAVIQLARLAAQEAGLPVVAVPSRTTRERKWSRSRGPPPAAWKGRPGRVPCRRP